MQFPRNSIQFVTPHTAVTLLLAVDILIYGLTLQRSGGGSTPSGAVLFNMGAMYAGALGRHEYWRFLAYGFLHGGMLHIVTNMACLALWGGPLEQRVGAAYFLMIFFGGVVIGAVTGIFTHTGPYFTVGASGGISAILGALLGLKLLRRVDLPASFFVVNLGLNVALAFISPRIDWGAHAGGLAAGILICVLLDRFEVAGPRLMRCKFPEFLKLNLTAWFVVVLLMIGGASAAPEVAALTAAAALAVLVGIVKAIDVALSRRHGLAFAVGALAVGNAVIAGVAVVVLVPAGGCAALTPANMVPWAANALSSLFTVICAHPAIACAVAVVAVFELTQLIYLPELRRGLADQGFVAASMRGERARRRGL